MEREQKEREARYEAEILSDPSSNANRRKAHDAAWGGQYTSPKPTKDKEPPSPRSLGRNRREGGETGV
jgi:hypothetical protein